jgi:hypothetical protein
MEEESLVEVAISLCAVERLLGDDEESNGKAAADGNNNNNETGERNVS